MKAGERFGDVRQQSVRGFYMMMLGITKDDSYPYQVIWLDHLTWRGKPLDAIHEGGYFPLVDEIENIT